MNRGDKAKIKQREQAIFNFKESVIEALDLGATLEELSNALNSLHCEMNPPPEPEPKPTPKEAPPKEVLRFGEDKKPDFSTFFLTGEGPSPNVRLNVDIRLLHILGDYPDYPMGGKHKNAGEILSMPKQRIMELRGMGPKYFQELKDALIKKGYQIYCPETHWVHEKD